MGKVGRDIQRVLSNHLKNIISAHKVMLERLENIHTFKEGHEFTFGPFRIMPVTIDHSAFDAYAFKIVADRTTIYHTGDFRLHGFRSGKTPEMLKKYVGKVDYIVCEGTNVSRPAAACKKSSLFRMILRACSEKIRGASCIYHLPTLTGCSLFTMQP